MTKTLCLGPGVVPQICNLSYWGGKNKSIAVLRSSQAKVNRILSQNKLGTVILTCNFSYSVAEVGGSWFEVNPGQKHKFLMEKQTKVKRTGNVA
jgi:hypothetical protein